MVETKAYIITKNTITSMPYTVLQASFAAFLLTGEKIYIYFIFFLAIFGNLTNMILKKIFKNILKRGERPSGCGVKNKSGNKTCTGCGIYTQYDTKSYTHGMPSGHSQTSALIATFWSLYLLANYQQKGGKKSILILKIIIIWLLAFVVMGQRVFSKCHNIPQVIVGCLFGVGFGILSYYLYCKIDNKKNPKILFLK